MNTMILKRLHSAITVCRHRLPALAAGLAGSVLAFLAAPGTTFGQTVPAYTNDPSTVLLDHFDGTTAGSLLGFRGQPCGPPNPEATPSYSYMPSLPDLGQGLSLQNPAGEPEGSGSYVRYPGGQILSIPNGTAECWVYLEALGTPHNTLIMIQYPYPGACAGNTFYLYVNATGQLISDAWDAFSVNSGSVLVPVKEWFHVAVSWGSAGAKLYLNGTLVGTDSNTGFPAPGFGGSLHVRVGSELPGASNRIDELRISSVQRTTFNLPQGSSANLILSQSTPAPVGLWGLAGYTLTVSNAGPAAATEVSLQDRLPHFFLLNSATPSQGTVTVVSNQLTGNLGSLAPGATATVQVLARARCVGSGYNSASVTSALSDPAPTNNTTAKDLVVLGAEVNIARNPSGSGFPSPLESDPGWGGGSYPWEIVDGLQTDPEWWHGLAFTGGSWMPELAGLRQATISLGADRTFYKAVGWHHGLDHFPETATLEYWNGSAWVPITAQRRIAAREAGGAGATSDEYVFAPVTGSKVRWWMDNRLNNILGYQNTHGWIYEFEVFAAQQCDAPALGVKRLVAVAVFGVPGRTYRVEYTPALADPPDWQTLTTVTITSLPTVVVDWESATAPQRFYRVVEQ